MSGRRVIMVGMACVAAATVVAAATAGSEATTAGSYKLAGKIGKEGKANGQFSALAYGLATDKAGNFYVSDAGNLRIQAFSARGAYKGRFTFAPGEVVVDVAVGPTGDVWGTTQVGAQVRRFPKSGAAENLSTPKSAEGVAIDAQGNVYVATNGDSTHGVVRFDKSAAGWAAAKMWVGGGLQEPGDVEVSPDGSVYVADRRGSPPSIRRYNASGKLLSTIRTKLAATAGAGAAYGIGVDPDCNVWATNGQQRRVDKFTPSGRLLGSVTSGDLLSTDIAVGPKGDLYVFDINTRSVFHFAEDRSKPARANVPGTIIVSGGTAKIAYTLSGVACPSVVNATATLTGPGISGKAAGLKLKAGARNTIRMKLSKAASGKATFKIVLKTNGRTTMETRRVSVNAR